MPKSSGGIEVDRTTPVPFYFQLAEMLKEQIESGLLKPGEQIPSERELSEQSGVSRMTVRQAVMYLVRQGQLVVRPGIGTFVGEPKLTHDTLHLLGFTEEMLRQGQAASSKVLEQALVEPPAPIAARLELPPQARAVRIVRLRFSRDTPLLLETVYISHALAPGLERADLSRESLYSLLGQYHRINLQRARQTLEVTRANADEAHLLGIASGDPMLLLQGVTYTESGHPVEAFKALYRGDKFKFELESQQINWVMEPDNAPRMSLVMR
jgi:GntR family transcriptional regulator